MVLAPLLNRSAGPPILFEVHGAVSFSPLEMQCTKSIVSYHDLFVGISVLVCYKGCTGHHGERWTNPTFQPNISTACKMQFIRSERWNFNATHRDNKIIPTRPCENAVQDERWNIATAIKISNFPADSDRQGTELLVTE